MGIVEDALCLTESALNEMLSLDCKLRLAVGWATRWIDTFKNGLFIIRKYHWFRLRFLAIFFISYLYCDGPSLISWW